MEEDPPVIPISTEKRAGVYNALKNTAVTITSMLFGYLLIGTVLLIYGPGIIWEVFNFFPVASSIWYQGSGGNPKKEAYIALLGDSYAAGIGDWSLERKSRVDPFYSGDVIAANLQRPVITFGKPGSSSVEALITNPGRVMNASICVLLKSPVQPAEFVVYFYEGNDLNDNVNDLSRNSGGSFSVRGQVVGSEETNIAINRFVDMEAEHAKGSGCISYINGIMYNFFTNFKKLIGMQSKQQYPIGGQSVRINGKKVLIPLKLQSPGLELDAKSMDIAFEVLDRALGYLIREFPGVPIMVVDVPSVLTNYQILDARVDIETYQGGSSSFPAALVATNSDLICARLRELILRRSLRFLDARKALRHAASKSAIHGPLDWSHFNKIGQISLGDAVASALANENASDECIQLSSAL
ncbi:MAG TPA: hypothetical protein VM144_18230 [Aestuariivirga sp.]|nr:hypothetical protein [Aestuariivirga sp.]